MFIVYHTSNNYSYDEGYVKKYLCVVATEEEAEKLISELRAEETDGVNEYEYEFVSNSIDIEHLPDSNMRKFREIFKDKIEYHFDSIYSNALYCHITNIGIDQISTSVLRKTATLEKKIDIILNYIDECIAGRAWRYRVYEIMLNRVGKEVYLPALMPFIVAQHEKETEIV